MSISGLDTEGDLVIRAAVVKRTLHYLLSGYGSEVWYGIDCSLKGKSSCWSIGGFIGSPRLCLETDIIGVTSRDSGLIWFNLDTLETPVALQYTIETTSFKVPNLPNYNRKQTRGCTESDVFLGIRFRKQRSPVWDKNHTPLKGWLV